jgi:hypothetical protein
MDIGAATCQIGQAQVAQGVRRELWDLRLVRDMLDDFVPGIDGKGLCAVAA